MPETEARGPDSESDMGATEQIEGRGPAKEDNADPNKPNNAEGSQAQAPGKLATLQPGG